MKLSEHLMSLAGERPRIALTGAGGKTSLLILLGRAYARRGLSVLMSTTTKVAHPAVLDYGCDTIALDGYDGSPLPGERVFHASSLSPRKVASPPLDELERISDLFDVVILEADGAKRMNVKYHGPRDPVVPSFSTVVIALMGLSSLGRSIEGEMHGSAMYRKASGDGDEKVSVGTLSRLLTLPGGARKGMGEGTRNIVLCNQCDAVGRETLLTLKRTLGRGVVYGSVQNDVLS